MSGRRAGTRRRALRFMAAYVRNGGSGIRTSEVTVPATAPDTADYEATVYHPRGAGPNPAWLMLPGLTALGRRHPSFVRLGRCLAASGSLALAPDIPALKALRFRTPAMRDAIDAGLAYLATDPDVRADALGLSGFSLCGTQALVAAANPATGSRIAAVFTAGAYCDLHRCFRFGMTGEHEWAGRRHRLTPNPYGRWLASLNYMTSVPGYGDMGAVGEGLARVARAASVRGIESDDPALLELRTRIRDTLDATERELWDFLAPPDGTPPDRDRALDYARALADAALELDPDLALPDELPLRCHAVLAHGADDRVLPFTEAHRLAARCTGAEPPLHILGFRHATPAAAHRPLTFLRANWKLYRFVCDLCEAL